MLCAYCNQETRPTKEHIISSGILDLFPECFITIDEKRKKVHTADPMVNDVCSECNNRRISYIDSYAKDFIGRYFVKKFEADSKLEIEYNLVMLQKMLLKYAFNDLRSRHENTAFFDNSIRTFLMNETCSVPLTNVDVLLGIAVNTSPAPDYMFGNLKLRWCNSPVFLSNSMVRNIDYATGQIYIREPFEFENFSGLSLSYIFRFNSGQFILMCWDENEPLLEQNRAVIKLQYPYEVLEADKTLAVICRCTSETTYHHFELVDANWGQGIMDEISLMRRLASPSYEKVMNSINMSWEKEEKRLAKEHKRK